MEQKQPRRASKQIIHAIMDEAGVKIARAYQMVEEVKRSKAVDVRTAANYVAAQLGIDVQKGKFGLTDLDKEKLRGILGAEPLAPSIRRGSRGKVGPRLVPVQIGPRVADTLLLSRSAAKEARKMSEVYSIIYVLENSFRQLITDTLQKRHGADWWNEVVIPSDTRKNVENRLSQEEENRWHSRRGSHRIFYTDFSDLGRIIISNWSDFKNIFKKQHRLQTKLEEIELSRNIVAHSNPLPDKEVRRLRLNFDDWKTVLKRSTPES